jgi:hypothetical protein
MILLGDLAWEKEKLAVILLQEIQENVAIAWEEMEEEHMLPARKLVQVHATNQALVIYEVGIIETVIYLTVH